ncbi:MAG: hypothetical protein IJ475_01595 [Bacilli bacterium]|nr:hypothetical protein [Bacilli bacterium]
MNFEEKLNVVLEEMKNVYGLTDSHISIIKLNVMRRVQLYKDINYVKNDNECSFLVSDDFIGDMFINRLINNIRHYDFSQVYDLDNPTKGCYISGRQEMFMGNFNSVRDLTRNRLEDLPNFNEQMLYNATIKVMNHEIGHAFQVGFSGSRGFHSKNFERLISNLVNKYPNDFEYIDRSNMEEFQSGMRPVKINDEMYEARSYYAKLGVYTKHLDEIFNEEESLSVTGINNPQGQYRLNADFEKKIYNYESSNYKITSYATLMKILLGKQKTFESMYLDSIVCYNYFDKYEKIAKEVFAGSRYSNNAPMLNVIYALDQIRNNNDIQQALKLDLFFSKILYEKAKDILRDSSLTIEKLNEFENDIAVFKANILHSNSVKLKQDVIISEIEELINNKKKELSNDVNKVHSDDMRYVAEQMKQAQIENDEVAYEYWKANLDRLIEQGEFDDDDVGVSISENYGGPAK